MKPTRLRYDTVTQPTASPSDRTWRRPALQPVKPQGVDFSLKALTLRRVALKFANRAYEITYNLPIELRDEASAHTRHNEN